MTPAPTSVLVRLGQMAVATLLVPGSGTLILAAALNATTTTTSAAPAARAGEAPAAPEAERVPRIVRVDPRFDDVVPRSARIETLASGFTWVEGPAWSRDGYWLFSDIPRNVVMKWQEGRGASVFLEKSGYSGSTPFTGREPGSNGLAIDAQGRLLLAQHGDRRIVRLEPDGSRTPIAERHAGKRLNSPNDLVIKSDGAIYFTDPPFGLPQAFDDAARELPYCGVYRAKRPGEVELLTQELAAPNGIAFSPDERTLYLTDVAPERAGWYAYPVADDGRLGKGRLLVDARPLLKLAPGGPDGLAVDGEGNLFASGPGGIYVFTAEGEHLGTLWLGTATSNCRFGEDGKSLFVTADETIYRLRVATGRAAFVPGR